MARYIDADALIEEIVNTPSNCMDTFSVSSVQNGIGYGCVSRQNEIINIINNQPTAFDLDKVVQELEGMREEYNKLYAYYLDGEDYRMSLAYETAIKIVKAGGIDERD